MIDGLHINDFTKLCLEELRTIKGDEKFRDEFNKCAKETGIDTDIHGGEKQAVSLFCLNEHQAGFKGPDGIYHPDHSQEYTPINDGVHGFTGDTIALGDLEIEGARAQKCHDDVSQRLSGNGVDKEHDKPVRYISPEQRSADQQGQNIDPVIASLAGAGLLVATLALRNSVVSSRVKEAASAVGSSALNRYQGSFASREVNSQDDGIQLV